MKIGVVGAETHTSQLCELVNLQRKIRGVRVSHVCAHSPATAETAAAGGNIPNIVNNPSEMIGVVDAAVVDHIDGRHHLPAAKPLLEAGIPLFVDKPFCREHAEGKRFLRRAAELKVPVCSFSVMPMQSAYTELKKQVRSLGEIYSVISTGPCDITSPFGGIYFYGIHQVEMILQLLGREVSCAQFHRGKDKNHVATLSFVDGKMATINLMAEGNGQFHLSVIGAKGRIDRAIPYDPDFFLPGIRAFVRMVRTGKMPALAEEILAPVAVLEVLKKSIAGKSRL